MNVDMQANSTCQTLPKVLSCLISEQSFESLETWEEGFCSSADRTLSYFMLMPRLYQVSPEMFHHLTIFILATTRI